MLKSHILFIILTITYPFPAVSGSSICLVSYVARVTCFAPAASQVHASLWFSSAVQLRSAFRWDMTPRHLVIVIQSFGIT